MSEITTDEATLTEEEVVESNKEDSITETEIKNPEVESDAKTESEDEAKAEDESKEDEVEDTPLDDLEKWKKFARQHESDKKKLKSENDELVKKLESSNKELEDLKHSLIIKEVVSELGLNEKQASFLSGKNKEELLKSGSELLEAFGSNELPKPKPKPVFKQGAKESLGSDKKLTAIEKAYIDFINREKGK